MKAFLYKVECLTNLHVGSGDSNYNIIDNEVERDPVLENVPVIHSSGVKGALREHFEINENWLNDTDEKLKQVFGKKGSGEEKESTPGQYKFFSANLLVRPLRVSRGDQSYVLATTHELIDMFKKLIKSMGSERFEAIQLPPSVEEKSRDIYCTRESVSGIEGYNVKHIEADATLKELIGEDYAIVKSFKDFSLPVLARNQLENSISKNLWYEEIVPHKSIFYFIVLTPDEKNLLTFSKPVQFGGNASIGYGYTVVQEVAL